MKGMPHFRQYPMGDVVNANLEPGEYVLRRNAVNALGVENMELLNHADGAHGALNKLMVSASLVNHQSQSNKPVKTEANGFPVADSPVRQRVDATRSMQEGGPVEDFDYSRTSGLYNRFLAEKDSPDMVGMQDILKWRSLQEPESRSPEMYDAQSDIGRQFGKDALITQALSSEEAMEGISQADRYKLAKSLSPAGKKLYYSQYFSGKWPGDDSNGYQGGGLLGMQYGGLGKKKGSPANGYQQGGVAENESSTFGKKSLKLLKQEMDRLKVEPEQKDTFIENMYNWSRKVRSVESDDRPEAMADTSSAKGVYQFTDSSVVTGKNRMKRRGFDKKFIDAIPDDPRKWNNEQADAMFLSNMFSQEGSDKYLMGIGSGDIDAGKEAYYKFHHTKPDTATIRRVEERMVPKNNFQNGGLAGEKKAEDCVGGVCEVPTAELGEGYRTMPWQGKNVTIDTMSRMEEDGVAQYLAEGEGGDYFMMNESDIPADSLSAWLGSEDGYQEGGPVERSDVNLQAVQAQASLDSLQRMPTQQGPQAGYNMPRVNPRPDSYGGKDVGKDLSAIIPYMKSFGRIPTPIQEKERWLYQRLGVNPDSLPPQLRGLAGRALLQRYGNEQE